MTLDVMIATIGVEGIRRVAAMNVPEVTGVRYIVSWQIDDCESKMIPDELIYRDDVIIYPHEDRGVSRNRNYAMSVATADVCLVADDDLKYTAEALRRVMATFAADGTLDVALFKHSGGGNKYYPDKGYEIVKLRKGHFVTEVEIAYRRCAVAHKVRFSEHLGGGATEICTGEGEMFLFTALRRGLRCCYFPVVIARHDGLSSGFRMAEKNGALMGQGVMIYMYHRHTWPLRIAVNAWRESGRHVAGFLGALRDMKNGALYARRFFNPDGTEKQL